MAHSSTSPSHSKKTQTVHFRATLQTVEIELVAKIRTLHQYNIELSIKRRSYNTQGFTVILGSRLYFFFIVLRVTVVVVLVLLQTKDLKCATHLLSEKFRNMSEEKKTIVRDLGFGGLMHIPPLREIYFLKKSIIRIFLKMTNKFLKDKKRAERPPEPWIANWNKEQLVERMKAEMEDHMGIVKMADTKEKMKEIKKKEKKEETKKKQKRKASSTSSYETETTESDYSTSESETEEDSEDSTRKQPNRKAKK
ncbi:hypothetical protein Ahy_A01g001587 [Arachis hypogaea]|uniref:Uncharacterized protein n=1 Tax=Arachis hypogaea TaxID=3818 RepID=A0A445EP85_ARAHY|nr:hypothetical protein Ahy_A01g001587 [Arachis hypogaea]